MIQRRHKFQAAATDIRHRFFERKFCLHEQQQARFFEPLLRRENLPGQDQCLRFRACFRQPACHEQFVESFFG